MELNLFISMLQGLWIFMPVGNKCLYDQGLHHYININLWVTMNFLQWISIFISEQSVTMWPVITFYEIAILLFWFWTILNLDPSNCLGEGEYASTLGFSLSLKSMTAHKTLITKLTTDQKENWRNPLHSEAEFPLEFVHVNAHTAVLCKAQTLEIFFYKQWHQENSNKAQAASADLAGAWFLDWEASVIANRYL